MHLSSFSQMKTVSDRYMTLSGLVPLLLFVGTRSKETSIVWAQNMQKYHSIRCKQIISQRSTIIDSDFGQKRRNAAIDFLK